MRNHKIIFSGGLIAFMLVFLAGCYYDEVLPEPPPPVDNSGQEISFAQDIIPIFNQSCNDSGCHNNGGRAPDLSPENAFDALTNGGYIDTVAPENSELYLWMIGDKGAPMPISGSDASYNSTVLTWISQGALNN
jgi:hypothetical protein